MIGSSFLSSSTWSSEILPKECLSSLDKLVLDIELENETNDGSEKWDNQSWSYSETPDHSSSSEECDWTSFDSTFNSLLPISVTQLLEEEENVVDSLDFNDLDWLSITSNFHDESSAAENIIEIPENTTDSPKKKKQKSPEHRSFASKSWSRMTIKERLRTAHILSDIISSQMDFREQIEVIKLIDPSAVLSSSDTEFALELSNLNDVKLKRIFEYLRKHTINVAKISSLQNSTTTTTSSTKNGIKAKRKKVQRTCIAPGFGNQVGLIEKKLIRQGKREKRSGLFVQEKLVKKLNNPQEEDEDVNILE